MPQPFVHPSITKKMPSCQVEWKAVSAAASKIAAYLLFSEPGQALKHLRQRHIFDSCVIPDGLG
jgi:hypothetical protein